MSDTPRTDAAAFSPGTGNQWEELVDADFARKLERELAAEQSRVSRIGAQLIGLEEKIDAVTRELAEARKDAARYRWLRDHGGKSYQETASQPAGILPCIFMRLPSLNESGSYVLRSESADAAIDAARLGDGNG